MTVRLRTMVLAAAALTGFIGAVQAAEPKMLTQEPGPGKLRSGETVLVDDGSCPANQIKQITGGSDRVVGTDTHRQGTPRQVSCVRR